MIVFDDTISHCIYYRLALLKLTIKYQSKNVSQYALFTQKTDGLEKCLLTLYTHSFHSWQNTIQQTCNSHCLLYSYINTFCLISNNSLNSSLILNYFAIAYSDCEMPQDAWMHGNHNAQWSLLRTIELWTWIRSSWHVYRKTKYVVLGCKFNYLYARLLSVIFSFCRSNYIFLMFAILFLIFFVPKVGESYGFNHYINITCVGSTLLISGAHTTPYDCFKLCDATEGCNVFNLVASWISVLWWKIASGP